MKPCRYRIRYLGSTSGMENVFAYFSAANASRRRCQVAGTPNVVLLDAKGRALPSHPRRFNTFDAIRHRAGSLRPRERAHFLLIFSQHQAGMAAFCVPVAKQLRVRVGDSAAVTIGLPTPRKDRQPINPCEGRFDVTPIGHG